MEVIKSVHSALWISFKLRVFCFFLAAKGFDLDEVKEYCTITMQVAEQQGRYLAASLNYKVRPFTFAILQAFVSLSLSRICVLWMIPSSCSSFLISYFPTCVYRNKFVRISQIALPYCCLEHTNHNLLQCALLSILCSSSSVAHLQRRDPKQRSSRGLEPPGEFVFKWVANVKSHGYITSCCW